MPRLVDHAERREAIIGATWRLIAGKGIEATGMRGIAAEVGYANAGTLSHYFANKDEILSAAYEHVYSQTNRRIRAALGESTGLDAIRLMAREIIPDDDVTVDEAKIAVSFWQRSLQNEAMRATGEQAMGYWRQQLAAFFGQARAAGTIESDASDSELAGELLALLLGTHITGLLDSGSGPVMRPAQIVDSFLRRLGPRPQVPGRD